MSTALLAGLLLAVLLLARRLLADLRSVPRLDPEAVAPVRSAAAVSVVVPARNEAESLPLLLDSLHRLGAPVGEVVVVDDGSEDDTAAVAGSAGATVVTVAGPPPGWTGKAWACHVGAQRTRERLLLFLDADTVLEPGALDGLLRLGAEQPGLLSVQPFHRVERPYEQLSAYFNVVSVLASGAFGRHPERRAMAFGPCLLTSRADYETAGGHAAVRGEILDDVRLAAAYQRAGLPVRCAVGGDAVRMRMYPAGPRQLVEGWTKNFASGAAAAAPGPTLSTVLWVAGHHAVAVGALLALVDGVAGGAVPLSSGSPVLWAVAWVAVAGQLRSMLHRLGSFRWWTWALFPLPLLAFDLVFARSVASTALRRSVTWRGRDVRLASRRSSREEV